MKNESVLEVLNRALLGEMEAEAFKLPVIPTDRVLGSLKSHLVPKLWAVVVHFKTKPSEINQLPNVNIGVEAVWGLIKSELLGERGGELKPNETITIRYESGKWIVVAVPRKRY